MQVFRNVVEEIDIATADLGEIQNIITTNGDSDARFETKINCLNRVNDLLAR